MMERVDNRTVNVTKGKPAGLSILFLSSQKGLKRTLNEEEINVISDFRFSLQSNARTNEIRIAGV